MAAIIQYWNDTNGSRCEYCHGQTGLIIMENLFKLKNLGDGVEYCLHPQNRQYLIGWDLEVHIPISKTGCVSKHHASVWVSDDAKLYITDAQSSNGTYVNGRKVTPGKPRRIKVHDIVSFGFPCDLAVCETHATMCHAVFKVIRNMCPITYKYELCPL